MDCGSSSLLFFYPAFFVFELQLKLLAVIKLLPQFIFPFIDMAFTFINVVRHYNKINSNSVLRIFHIPSYQILICYNVISHHYLISNCNLRTIIFTLNTYHQHL